MTGSDYTNVMQLTTEIWFSCLPETLRLRVLLSFIPEWENKTWILSGLGLGTNSDLAVFSQTTQWSSLPTYSWIFGNHLHAFSLSWYENLIMFAAQNQLWWRLMQKAQPKQAACSGNVDKKPLRFALKVNRLGFRRISEGLSPVWCWALRVAILSMCICESQKDHSKPWVKIMTTYFSGSDP